MSQKPPPIIEQITSLRKITGVLDITPVIEQDDIYKMIENGDLVQLIRYASSSWDYDALSSLAAYYGHVNIIKYFTGLNDGVYDLNFTGHLNAIRGMHQNVLGELYFSEAYFKTAFIDTVDTNNRVGYQYLMQLKPTRALEYLSRFRSCRFPGSTVKDFIFLYKVKKLYRSDDRESLVRLLAGSVTFPSTKFNPDESSMINFLIWQSPAKIPGINCTKRICPIKTRLMLTYRLNLPPEINLEIAKYLSYAPEYYIKQVFNSCHRIKGRGRLF